MWCFQFSWCVKRDAAAEIQSCAQRKRFLRDASQARTSLHCQTLRRQSQVPGQILTKSNPCLKNVYVHTLQDKTQSLGKMS